MKMFTLPRFVRTFRAQVVQTMSLLSLIWLRRDVKQAERKVLGNISKASFYQRRLTQIIGLGFTPEKAQQLVRQYGVGAASAAVLAALALRYSEPLKKRKRPSRQKIIMQLMRPVDNGQRLNKTRRLRSVLCHPYLNLDKPLRRVIDGITLGRNEYVIGMFYDCLVHLMMLSDDEFPPKPDMTGIEYDPTMFEWADEEVEVM